MAQLEHAPHFKWYPCHEAAFEAMKRVVKDPALLTPLPKEDEYWDILVCTDASLVGCGGYISFGKDFETSKLIFPFFNDRNASFFVAKLTSSSVSSFGFVVSGG